MMPVGPIQRVHFRQGRRQRSHVQNWCLLPSGVKARDVPLLVNYDFDRLEHSSACFVLAP
jgi:hypothetical protein